MLSPSRGEMGIWRGSKLQLPTNYTLCNVQHFTNRCWCRKDSGAVAFAAPRPLVSVFQHRDLTRQSPSCVWMEADSHSAAGGSEAEAEVKLQRIRNSKLYDVASESKDPLLYSSHYDIAFMGLEKLHPFDSRKWGNIKKYLVNEKVVDAKRIVEPNEATKSDLLVVHTDSYLQSLKSSYTVAVITEVAPVALLPHCIIEKQILQPFRRQVGGTILAARLAQERGWAINLVERVMIIDLDAHQGNGHARDYLIQDDNSQRVYIFDMYNRDIYPYDEEAKQRINRKVEIRTGTTTEQYIAKLKEQLQKAAEEFKEKEFKPQLIIYNAGTDILDGDPLGGLQVSAAGVQERDEIVFKFARRELDVPIVMVTSGGYMKRSARVIADSIKNLASKDKQLIQLENAYSSM